MKAMRKGVRVGPRPAGLLLAVLLAASLGMGIGPVRADVKLPAIFGDHMVLQRDQPDRVWGWADPGEEVTVQVAPGVQEKRAVAAADGKWQVQLDPLPVGGPYEITVRGKNTITFKDVLSGEVWICSGQSNMQWPLALANDPDLEIRSAKYPGIRLITVPNRGPRSRRRISRADGCCAVPRRCPGSRRSATSSAASSTRPWACRSA